MTVAEIREKLSKGGLSDEQFLKLLNELRAEAEFEPEKFRAENETQEDLMLKKLPEYSILLVILAGTVLLSYWNKVDITLTICLLSVITGYVLGKIR